MAGKSSQSRSESGGKTAFFLAIFMLVLALAGKYYIMKLARGDNSSKSVHSAHAATPTTHRHTLQLTIPLVLSSRSVFTSPEITHNRADS